MKEFISKKRNMAMHMLLFIITCGIYAIIYTFYEFKNENSSFAKKILLTVLSFYVIIGIVYAFTINSEKQVINANENEFQIENYSTENIEQNNEQEPKEIIMETPKIIEESKPIIQQQIPNQTEAKNITVYITRTGSKYHKDGCRYLRQSQIPMDLNSAKNSYSPCSVCNPPR